MYIKIFLAIALSAASVYSDSQVEDQQDPSAYEVLSARLFDGNSTAVNGVVCGCEYGNGQFCGLDGQCHYYNCASFYEFGPRNYTGYDNENPIELKCQTVPQTEVLFDTSSTSVSFRCRDLDPSPISMGWTRVCSAIMSNGNFTCYELAQDTDFQDFLLEASNSNLECNSDSTYFNETGYPKYTYNVVPEKIYQNSFEQIFLVGYNDTEEFDETKALTGTMHSMYKVLTDAPTQSPTPAPTI